MAAAAILNFSNALMEIHIVFFAAAILY